MTGAGHLRFAMVTTFYPPYHFGGDAIFVRSLAHALARRGHQVDVIHDVDAFRMRSKSEPEPIKEPDGVRVHSLRSRLGWLSCLATHQIGHPIVHRRTIKRILGAGFDVIHYHNISLVGGPGVLALGKGVKLYTTHEHWLVCPTHVLWRHQRELCNGRQCLRCHFHYRVPPQLWRATQAIERYASCVDAFLAPSQFCADKHAQFGFRRPMHVLPNFLPDPGAAPDPDPPPQRPFFLIVGRLERIKGIQDVIPLFEHDSPADLLIAGTGDYEPQLRALAGERPCVRFLGRQTQEQLRNLYRQTRAVILPSICFEVAPMVLLEAFREGAPVIARDLGPCPEIVNASQGGLLFRSTRELRSQLLRLVADDQLYQRFSKAGREAFEQHWCEDVVLRHYFHRIHQIARAKKLDHVAKIAAEQADIPAELPDQVVEIGHCSSDA